MTDTTRSAVGDAAADPAEWPASSVDDRRLRRAGTAAFGVVLLGSGLRRRSPAGAALVLLGGWILYRAAVGPGDAREPGVAGEPSTVTQSVTIGRSTDELSTLLRDPEQLGRIVGHVADVTGAGDGRQRWTVRGPLGRAPSWETRIVRDADRLRWEVIDGTALAPELSASFSPAPGDRGTEVVAELRLDAPGGALGTVATRPLALVLEPVLGAALDRFKGLAETGEIATTAGNPSARGRGELL